MQFNSVNWFTVQVSATMDLFSTATTPLGVFTLLFEETLLPSRDLVNKGADFRLDEVCLLLWCFDELFLCSPTAPFFFVFSEPSTFFPSLAFFKCKLDFVEGCFLGESNVALSL